MSKVIVNNKDQIIMSLVHYFVTKENYSPIVVQGAKNEIWLENLSAPYKIIRINSNYIHNEEQYEYDILKVKHILKQIKKKTFSFKVTALNICLDIADRVNIEKLKSIDTILVNNLNDLKKDENFKDIFPNIEINLVKNTDNIDSLVSVTNDINDKTERENKIFENIFKSKKIIFTYAIIALCIIMFMLSIVMGGATDIVTLLTLGANNVSLVKEGEVFRIITSIFLHYGFLHLFVNMYSLYIIGTQVETFMGKARFLIIYLISGISGSLMSLIFSDPTVISVGASGAIFGLLGSLLYLGYHYRLYLNDALKSQIIPVIVINLIIGFTISGIDNAAHIGGLIGGYLATAALGLKNKTDKKESINASIVLVLYIAFLVYMIFFR